MKLDEKYFEEKLEEFYDYKFWNKAKILHQIARDGAEAQRNKCFPDCDASNSCPCESATVKWEVPGE